MSKTPVRGQARRNKIETMRAEEQRQSRRKKNTLISLSVIGVFVLVLGAVFATNRFASGADTPD